MSETKLLPCPFCGGKAKMEEFYESCDGRGDRYAKIKCCKCGIVMCLTSDEFYDAQKEFGHTGGYYSQNKAFWYGMHQKLIDKWNARKPAEKILERLESGVIFYNSASDLDQCVRTGLKHAIEIIKEEVQHD